MKIIITGSSGLVGSALSERLMERGDEVIRVTRTPSPADATIVLWKPEAREIMNTHMLEGADAVIHLAGENVGDARWTPQKKASIRNSRIQGTGLIAHTLTQLEKPPQTFICASAIGYYGKNRGDEVLTEDSPVGKGFLAGVCRDWEDATGAAADAGIRTASLRIGFVISAEGGGMKKLLPPFKLGLGGTLGSGKQWMSWITLEDLVQGILFVMDNNTLSGPVNLVAPEPCTNKTFTKTLGKVIHRPTLFPVPPPVLRLVAGELAEELLLASHRVVPGKLANAGFTWKYPELSGAFSSAIAT